jgi:hypothetical protein
VLLGDLGDGDDRSDDISAVYGAVSEFGEDRCGVFFEFMSLDIRGGRRGPVAPDYMDNGITGIAGAIYEDISCEHAP